MASAGRMRPKTRSPGSLTTPSVSPVRTMTFSTTLVKRPKNAFQSPGTHQRTGCSEVAALAICPPVVGSTGLGGLPRRGQGLEEALGVRDPAEDAALRLDHRERGLLEIREVGGDAVLEHEAVVAAVVG